MDTSDPRHGSHPSQPIPDAAYPDDSPFRPSAAGPSYSATIELQPVSISTASLSQHASSSSQPHASSVPTSSPTNTASHGNNSAMDPPPPYEPARPAATYSSNPSSQSLRPQQHPSPPYLTYPPPSPNPYEHPGNGGAYKPDSLADERRRQVLRAKMKAVMLGVTVGVAVLVIGLVLYLMRKHWMKSGGD